MYLTAFQLLLVLSALVNFQGSCLPNAVCVSTDNEPLTIHIEEATDSQPLTDHYEDATDSQLLNVDHEDAHQVPLTSDSPTTPGVPLAGNRPLTSNALIELVRKDFASKIPLSVHVRQIMDNVVGTLNHWDKSAPLSWRFFVDVRVPLMTTCRPVIRGATTLSKGIACGSTSCSHSTRFKVSQSYSATEGLRIETSFTVGGGYGGVEASISTSRERFWEKTWTQGTETEVEYTFNLGPGERCTPAKAHVELECDVQYDVVHYDSYYRRPQDWTDLEYRTNRKRGPFQDGQWCWVQPVQPWPVQQNGDWNEVLPNDGFDGNRGDIWKRPGSEMNRWRTSTPRRAITDQDIVIRRSRSSKGNMNEVFVCQRNPSLRRWEKITVPLSSSAGALPGYIGCIV